MQKQNSSTKQEKGIYVESKPVRHTDKLPRESKYGNSNHLYLIYKDGKGNERIIRGGPVNAVAGLLGENKIQVQQHMPLIDSEDKYNKGTEPETRFSKKLDIPENNLDQKWNDFNQTAGKIDNLGIVYRNTISNDVIQNSNSTIRTVLEKNGFNPNENYPLEVKNKIPGFETNLLTNPKLTPRMEPPAFDMNTIMNKEEKTSPGQPRQSFSSANDSLDSYHRKRLI